MTEDVRRDYFHHASAGAEAAEHGLSVWMGSRGELPRFDIGDGITFQPVYGQQLLLNFVHFEPRRTLPNHSHPEEQLGMIVDGEMELTVGGEARHLRAGDVYVIPPNVAHSGRTEATSCIALDIFSPPRSGFSELLERARRIH